MWKDKINGFHKNSEIRQKRYANLTKYDMIFKY